MKPDWIFETYRKVKENRDRELERVLAILRPKAAGDPEILEVLSALESWSRESDENSVTNETPSSKSSNV